MMEDPIISKSLEETTTMKKKELLWGVILYGVLMFACGYAWRVLA